MSRELKLKVLTNIQLFSIKIYLLYTAVYLKINLWYDFYENIILKNYFCGGQLWN